MTVYVTQQLAKSMTSDAYMWVFIHLGETRLAGLKPGRVIQVNRVTFCPGQVGLTRFIRYPSLTRILNCITCVDDGVWLW